MVSLTFYGGANEIGGSKILLEDKNAKIYLDFGQSFGFGEDFFYEYLAPRSVNGLECYFEFDLIPKIKKLYSKRMLKFTDLEYKKANIDAVFISHCHSDHAGHLQFLDEQIPIYMGHGAGQILQIQKFLYPQFVKLGEHKSFNLFKSGDKIKVKHLVIEPIHVEHSTPGAYGFIIHTSKGAVVYTGDFRLHGPKEEFTREFIEKCTKVKPYAMLCEGTRMAYEVEHNFTEKEVEEKASEIIKKSKGIVFANFAMTNIDRFMSFYRAAVKNKRKMVVDTRFAYILDKMKEKIEGLPDVREDENILVYFRVAKSCEFCEKDYKPWEREYMHKMVTYKEIGKMGKKLVMHMRFFALMEFVYIQPTNADFIYSMSEHFLEGEENEETRTILENWLKHFDIKMHKAHCSGHADKKGIIEVIKKINPKILIPVHTQNAEEFKKFHKNVILPEKNGKIEI
ncbi:MAG: MBL fold metallo-hydrolase [Candidatus Micrarchaeota archaeon]